MFSTGRRLSTLKEKRVESGRKLVKTGVLWGVTSELPDKNVARRLDGARTAKEPDGKHEDSTNKTENSVNGDSH
jgi:hypothetical protein